LAKIGLVDRIHTAAANIDIDRKGFATREKAKESIGEMRKE
jgi:hypothetical protein